MKKILSLILAVFMITTLAGCSEGETPVKTTEKNETEKTTEAAKTTASEADIPDVDGEIYATEQFRALVPEGWAAFPITDVFTDDNAIDPTCFNIIKGGTSDFDLFSKPYVRLDYYGPDTEMMKPGTEWYKNVEEIEAIQLGSHIWTGFTGEDDYGKVAILWAEEGKIQYQASLWLEVEGKTISLDDDDVRAILASVGPADGTEGTAAPTTTQAPTAEDYSWWDGDWYGWWAIKNGTGAYKQPSDMGLVWDAFAEIEVYNDNTGFIEIWDTGTTKDDVLIYGYEIVFEPGKSDLGRMVSSRVVFFPGGSWNNGMEADTMDERTVGWTIDPADSTVSHFENMLEITGHYSSPENPEDSFDYFIYLRPWGTVWEDVRNGDTEGCIYSDMMPLYHDNWYVSLLNLGYERPVSSFDEGIDIINDYLSGSGGGSLDPSAKEGADGKVDMATLKSALAWCKENASYSTTYDEIAARFGAHGLLKNDTGTHRFYRWWATDEAYVQITFTVEDDGNELWNVTQYNGIS